MQLSLCLFHRRRELYEMLIRLLSASRRMFDDVIDVIFRGKLSSLRPSPRSGSLLIRVVLSHQRIFRFEQSKVLRSEKSFLVRLLINLNSFAKLTIICIASGWGICFFFSFRKVDCAEGIEMKLQARESCRGMRLAESRGMELEAEKERAFEWSKLLIDSLSCQGEVLLHKSRIIPPSLV